MKEELLKNHGVHNGLVPQGVRDTENILYEMGEGGAVEVRLPAKFPLSETPPLFEGNAVSRPIVVCKEGTYVKPTLDKRGEVVLKKITFSKADLEAFVANAARDVPLNVDHYRGGMNYYGWVRTKTGEFKVAKDDDGRWALFAQIEVTPATLQAIERGLVRDFSPEIRPYEKRFVGLALTNYPVMQELHQFSEVVEEDFSEGNDMSVEEFAKYKDEMDRKFSELQSKLLEADEARKRAEAKARTAQLALEFSDKVARLVRDEDGKARIAPTARDAVLSLYLFAAEHEDVELSFSEEGKEVKLSPVALLDKVFSSLPAATLFAQESPAGAASADEAEGDDFSDFDLEAAKKLARARMAELGK